MNDNVKRYYLAVFNEDTWNIFQKSSVKQYATKITKQGRADKINLGDLLICYVTKRMVFVAVLEVISRPYICEANIFSDSLLLICLDCKVIEEVPLEKGIKIKDIMEHISFLQNIKNEKKWASFFWNAFNEFSYDDAKVIITEMKK